MFYLTDSKTFKLDTFKIFKYEYITFCLSINTIGLYCNKMLCFAHVFYNMGLLVTGLDIFLNLTH